MRGEMVKQEEDTEKEKKGTQQKAPFYPPIPPAFWYEAEVHSMDTHETEPLLDGDKEHVVINSYPLLRQFGHRDYMSWQEALKLADKIYAEAERLHIIEKA